MSLPGAVALGLATVAASPATAAAAETEQSLLAETRAARDGGDYAQAEALARRGMALSADPVWPLTLALVLVDQRRTAEAMAVLSAAYEPPLPPKERLLAEAYAQRRGGDSFAALRAYGEVLLIDPANGEAKAATAALLDEQRAAYGAARLEGLPPVRWADSAASLTRWGAEVREPARPFDITDRALASADALLARLAADSASDPALVRRVRLDRMVALRDRRRMAEVVAEADDLRRGGALPLYVLQAEADARLALRQPEAALRLYEELLSAEPDNLEAAYGRVFALVETESLTEAIAAADAIAASRPRFTSFGDGPATTPDVEVLYATLLSGQVRLWSNFEDEGHARLLELARGAPANASLRAAMAGAHAARGFPRAAEAEAEIAVSLDPEGMEPQITLANMALVRRRYPEARARIAQLAKRDPEDQRVVLLAREARAATGWQLEADFVRSVGEGGGVNRQGDGYALTTRIVTPLLGPMLRLYAGLDDSEATVQEGVSDRTRLSGGVMLEGVDVIARGEVSTSFGTLEKAGFGASVDWSIDDHWSVSAEAERFSRQTPLRALLAGITTDSAALAARYRANERMEVSLRGGWYGYTDGNDAFWVNAAAARRLATTPHFDLTGRAELAVTGNSDPGGPYFAPERDFAATLGLTAQHVSWRRYQRSFVQAFDADAGLYKQRGFAETWIANARYEHRWRVDPWRELVYGVGISRRVYDGEPERMITISAGLRQRF